MAHALGGEVDLLACKPLDLDDLYFALLRLRHAYPHGSVAVRFRRLARHYRHVVAFLSVHRTVLDAAAAKLWREQMIVLVGARLREVVPARIARRGGAAGWMIDHGMPRPQKVTRADRPQLLDWLADDRRRA